MYESNPELEKLYNSAKKLDSEEKRVPGQGRGVYQVPMNLVAVLPGRLGLLFHAVSERVQDCLLDENAMVRVFHTPPQIHRSYNTRFTNKFVVPFEKKYRDFRGQYIESESPEKVSIGVTISTRRDLVCWIDGFNDLELWLSIRSFPSSDDIERMVLIEVKRPCLASVLDKENTFQKIGINPFFMFGYPILNLQKGADRKDIDAFNVIMRNVKPYTGYPYDQNKTAIS